MKKLASNFNTIKYLTYVGLFHFRIEIENNKDIFFDEKRLPKAKEQEKGNEKEQEQNNENVPFPSPESRKDWPRSLIEMSGCHTAWGALTLFLLVFIWDILEGLMA